MIETRKSWQKIPMPEFPHLSVIRDENGKVVATVQNEYADAILALPELHSASRELFTQLTTEHKQWTGGSLLGRLQKAISRIKLGSEPQH